MKRVEGSREHCRRIHKEAKSFKGHGTSEDVEKLHRKLVDNLLKRRREWLFRFVIDPDVESTNNRAERALRPSVIHRKVSGGTRSERGSEAYARISSIYYTTKLRKQSFIKDVPAMIRRKPDPG